MEQLNLFASYERTEPYMQHIIWQPETKMKPWCVHLEGWRDTSLDVDIYHEDINSRGCASYHGVRFKSAKHFANFVGKMLNMYINAFSKPYIELRAIDLLALEDGYLEGVKNAPKVYIESVKLN